MAERRSLGCIFMLGAFVGGVALTLLGSATGSRSLGSIGRLLLLPLALISLAVGVRYIWLLLFGGTMGSGSRTYTERGIFRLGRSRRR